MPMRPLAAEGYKRVRVEPPPRAIPARDGPAQRDPPALPRLGLMADCEI